MDSHRFQRNGTPSRRRIGIPPMLELAKELSADKKIILGYRDEQYLAEELAPAETFI